MRWFSLDSDGCTELHATAEAAKAAAEASLEWCRDQAADEEGWPEDTERILWGEVREGATRRVVHAHDETCRDDGGRLTCDDADWDATWEYDLLPPVDAGEDAAEGALRARAEAAEREAAQARAEGAAAERTRIASVLRAHAERLRARKALGLAAEVEALASYVGQPAGEVSDG